jgi:hypothetical protein
VEIFYQCFKFQVSSVKFQAPGVKGILARNFFAANFANSTNI